MAGSNGSIGGRLSDEVTEVCNTVAELQKIVRKLDRLSTTIIERRERRAASQIIAVELEALLEVCVSLNRCR